MNYDSPNRWWRLGLFGLSLGMIGAGSAVAQEEDEDIATLNPFAVNEAANTGYIATESIIASGFVQEVYKTPMNIQILTDDFMEDLGMDDIADATEYISGATAVQGPASGNASDGAIFWVRGLRTSWNTRNGIRRYAVVGNENVDRVEVIKGPLTTFFGQQAPGGILNYVTKRPSFTEMQEVNFRVGTDEQLYGSFESQGPIGDSDEWAYRFMISENQSKSWQDFEFIDRTFLYGGVMWQPSPNTQIIVEAEWIESLENQANEHPKAPVNYMEDWTRPPAEAIQWAIDNGITNPDGPQYAKQRDAAGNLILDASGNPQPIVATDTASAKGVLQDRWLWNQGAWVNDMNAAGFTDRTRRVRLARLDMVPFGWETNLSGPSSTLYNELKTVTFEVAHSFNDTFTFRGSYLIDDQVRGGAYNNQSNLAGNGGFQNMSLRESNNDNWSWNLKAELLTEFDMAGMRHKILTGAERYYDEWRQFDSRAYRRDRTEVAYNNQYLGGYDIAAELAGDTSQRALAPTLGSPTAQPWDPRNVRNDGWWDINTYYEDNIPAYTRKNGDESDYWRIQENTRDGLYASWTVNAFEDRLSAMASIRDESFESFQVNQQTGQASPNAIEQGDTVPSFGAVFELTDGIAVFGNFSRAYNVNWARPARTGPDGTRDDLTEDELTTRGLPKESEGYDFGLKFSWDDANLNGAISYFSNEEDVGAIRDPGKTEADPRNADGFERVTILTPGGRLGTEGLEIDVFWTPFPEYTVLFSYGYIPDAEVLTAGPGGEFQNRVGQRLDNVPEHDFSMWHRYSFLDGALEGLNVGLGLTYQSEKVINTNPDWDGILLDSYYKLDALVAYTTDAFGPETRFALNINNLLDEEYYMQGNAWRPGDARTITFNTSVRW